VTARRRTSSVLLGLSLAAGLVAGCGGPGSSDEPGSTSRTITVLAAASLTETFTTLADDFEADHPGVHVRLAFDSSATLAEQVVQGAPADVLATADQASMQTVADAGGTAGKPRLFATNHLQLVVPKDDPASIERLSDLDRHGVDYVVCVRTAPCGKLARAVLADSGVRADPASEEVDVKAVLSKVSLDEADAGLVYATDAVAAAGTVAAIDLPASGGNSTTYPVAALDGSGEPTLARQFVELVLSARGRRVLTDAGFDEP
jgi:molybdate transport system substrate-binding protein